MISYSQMQCRYNIYSNFKCMLAMSFAFYKFYFFLHNDEYNYFKSFNFNFKCPKKCHVTCDFPALLEILALSSKLLRLTKPSSYRSPTSIYLIVCLRV